MFPWVYEFRWSLGHVIFLGIFFSVLGTVFGSVVTAALRSRRDLRARRDDAIRWHGEFADLPRAARACRHELSGEVPNRTCDHEFDCRSCATHPTFLAHAAPAPADPNSDAFGIAMPADRLYHRGHAWVKPEEDGLYTIGLDDFAARLLGRADAVELPPPGTELKANGTGWHMVAGEARVRILAPIDGVVVDQGSVDKGWLLKVQGSSDEVATRHLLRGSEVRPWVLRELERLQFSLAAAGTGATLADGGELVGDVRSAYPQLDWDNVCAPFFLEA